MQLMLVNVRGNFHSASLFIHFILQELLQDGNKFVHARASSPTTVVASNAPSTRVMERKTPTVRYATKQTEKAVSEVFEHPREFMSGSVFRLGKVLLSGNVQV